ncbi:helicase associated domain-containing protein [Rhodococcus zopfii]|uniref:helicase associated domain-containing protein n=1 Tax=Rhodococcus zopfii TaxID=43772 RepID=UPI0009321009|nr:helicase associated domain-containing protein [Rhodococcus zopfii]
MREERFETGLAHLRTYVDQRGDGHVPRSWVCPDCGFALGSWVAHKRTALRSGNAALTPERLARLRAAGFETTSRRGVRGPTSLHQQQWEHGLDHLRTYVAAHGDADVPRRHVTGDGFALGMWVQSRRKELRSGKLTDPDRLNALSKLGFIAHSDRRGGFAAAPNADLQHLEKAVATVDSRTDTKPV